jgi:hypothetical protein
MRSWSFGDSLSAWLPNNRIVGLLKLKVRKILDTTIGDKVTIILNMKKNQVKMKHFRKWAGNRNPFFAAMALIIAGFAKEFYELHESVRKGKRKEGDIPIPSLKTWLKLYNNPKRIGKALLGLLGEANEEAAQETAILKLLGEGANQLQNNPEKVQAELKKLTADEWNEIQDVNRAMMHEFLELAINNYDTEFNKKEKEKIRKDITKPELIFFIRVMAPCFSIYKTYPLELLKQAQNGNDEALEKLIRLDKSIIFEPKISEIIHQAQALKAQARISMIKKAFISTPKAPLKMRAIKFHFGGLISFFSQTIKQKITAADIWRLYDAIALDMTGDVDEDFKNMSIETFEKDIQDARKMWQSILSGKKLI